MSSALSGYKPTGLHILPFPWKETLSDLREVISSEMRITSSWTTFFLAFGASSVGMAAGGPIGLALGAGAACNAHERKISGFYIKKLNNHTSDCRELFAYEMKRIQALQGIALAILRSLTQEFSLSDLKKLDDEVSQALQKMDEVKLPKIEEKLIPDRAPQLADNICITRTALLEKEKYQTEIWRAESDKLFIIIGKVHCAIQQLKQNAAEARQYLASLPQINTQSPSSTSNLPAFSYSEPQISKPTPLTSLELSSCITMFNDITSLAKAILNELNLPYPDISQQQATIDSKTTSADTRCLEMKKIATFYIHAAADGLRSLQEIIQRANDQRVNFMEAAFISIVQTNARELAARKKAGEPS